MNQSYLIFGIFLIATIAFLIVLRLKNKKQEATNGIGEYVENNLTSYKVANDKLVIVEDATENELKKILQDFCNSYNKKSNQAIPLLTKLTDNKFAITFPYDIKFEIYCFFINYLNYPMGFDKHFRTIGWVTTKANDAWITEKSINKNVMLYVSDFDDEYDNVYLTTSDNIGYKLGFAMGEEKKLLNYPEKHYEKPPINIHELNNERSIEFK